MEVQKDKRGQYIEHNGLKYRYWTKRQMFLNQKGNVPRMLHRVLWEERHGQKIPKAHAVVPKGSWLDLDEENWICRPHAYNGRQWLAKHEMRELDGKRYYKHKKQPYFYHTRAEGKKTTLHRDICAKFHGDIPDGYEVHHIDFNPDNNDSTNLVALLPEEHRRLHSEKKLNVKSRNGQRSGPT